VVSKIEPDEDDSDTEVKYKCEWVMVGNRRTKVTQKSEKVKKPVNRRTLVKKIPTIVKKGKHFA
jgi:hypothetical protein